MGSVKSNLDPILLIVFNYFLDLPMGMALDTLGVNGRRDKITIMSDLLEIMQEPHRLTHILYKSNMSYLQLTKYLDDLIERGLAERKQIPHRSYTITSNGKLFIDLVKGNEIGLPHL